MSDILIYKDGSLSLNTRVQDETVWLTQKELAKLFDVNIPAISKHIKNIYKSGELNSIETLSKMETVQKEGNRKVKREIEFYNLDMIIAVGYRVNSKKATKFRIWATKILKEYMIKGYILNRERVQQEKLNELNQTIELIKQSLNSELDLKEAKGFTEIVTKYAKSWALLQGYDNQSLKDIVEHREQKFILDYNEAKEAIAQLKETLIAKGEATELFGQEKAGEFKGTLLNIYQSFGGEDLLPSVEEKSANLLYYIIKGHPFIDGNKRIGSYLFILFLHKNGILHKANGEIKINDNALASLALLVAISSPKQKEIIIKLIINMLYDGDI